MINRVPQPSLLAFAAHKAPHLIHLGLLHLPKDDINVQRIKRVEQPFIHLLDGWLFFSRVAKLAGGSLLQASRDTMLDRDGSADAACAADDGSQDAGAAPATSAAGRGQAPPP